MIIESTSDFALPASLSSDASPAPDDVLRGSARLSLSKADPASATNRTSPSHASRRGRPRALDDAKRQEITALVAGGCTLREAAKHVGCGINTIRRELERNPLFSENFRRSQKHAQLSPLRTMQRAARKHWRAAAWLLERIYPERFARRDAATLYARQASRLRNELILLVRRDVAEPYLQARLVKHVKAVFDSSIRDARESQRTSGELRHAIESFDRRQHPEHAAPNHPDDPANCTPVT
jgi:transposase